MELQLVIINGKRKGTTFSLSHINDPMRPIQWLKENEAIEFRLTVSDQYCSAVLELYEYSIEATNIQNSDSDGMVTFIWTPPVRNGYQYECLFINYFGIAELNVVLSKDVGTESSMEVFQPIEVLASKITGDRVEEMFEFLAALPGEALHSVFRATRHSVGFDEGGVSPSFTQERLEYATEILQTGIPLILQHPITRLVPEHRLVSTTGTEEIDDSSLGWLLSNLSVLQECDSIEEAHLNYESGYYKADLLQLPVLSANSDLYENRVLHGFVDLLLHEAQMLIARYTNDKGLRRSNDFSAPQGYTSFFDKVSRFKKQLLGRQVKRCEGIIDNLKALKILLEARLPVHCKVMHRPSITPKARVNHAYRDIFIDIIRWHEHGRPDWSAFENLFAIQSIPTLFEAYCFFRTADALHKAIPPKLSENGNNQEFNCFETMFIDPRGTEVWLRREPIYWTTDHNKAFGESYVNTEGWTVDGNGRARKRGHRGPYAQRSPDISLEIKGPDGISGVILLDAKYTYRDKAFSHYLPELTMKYVHGIHRVDQGAPTVKSLTILHPDTEASFRSFHHESYGVFGAYPVTPNLQSVGLVVGKQTDKDDLEQLLRRILILEGVMIENKPQIEAAQKEEDNQTKHMTNNA